MKVIYADILILVNFAADYIALYACGRILELKIKKIKLFAASAAGVFCSYICEIYLYNLQALTLMFSLIFVTLMNYIAYGATSKIGFAKLCILFVLFSASLSGGMELLSQILIMLYGSGLFKNGMSLKMFALLSAAMSAFSIGFTGLFKRSKAYGVYECKILLQDTTELDVKLSCDTGNTLVDPYTRLPVIIIKKQESVDFSIENGLRYIPAKTVNGSSVLMGVKPKNVRIMHEEKFANVDAVVAFDNGDCDYNGCDGIIPYQLICNI